MQNPTTSFEFLKSHGTASACCNLNEVWQMSKTAIFSICSMFCAPPIAKLETKAKTSALFLFLGD